MARHLQRECCYQQLVVQKIRPGSPLQSINARHQKVSCCYLQEFLRLRPLQESVNTYIRQRLNHEDVLFICF